MVAIFRDPKMNSVQKQRDSSTPVILTLISRQFSELPSGRKLDFMNKEFKAAATVSLMLLCTLGSKNRADGVEKWVSLLVAQHKTQQLQRWGYRSILEHTVYLQKVPVSSCARTPKVLWPGISVHSIKGDVPMCWKAVQRNKSLGTKPRSWAGF